MSETTSVMRAYRISIGGIVIFALAYPLIAGSVLVRDWNRGVGEIFPVAPWALFCFVPNHESEFTVRLSAVDGRELEHPQFFEELAAFDEHQKTIGRGIIHEMGTLAGDDDSQKFNVQRRLFEQNYLAPIAKAARYELVRREYDVLQRWRTGEFQSVESIAAFLYRADAEER